jgi:surface polysaccharide O-acyltransferase-like enzyme
MCIGLVVLFRDIANVRTPLLTELGRGQYLAYVIHVAPVIGLQAIALALPISPLAKFALVTVAAIPLSFMLAGLLRRPLKM